MYKSVHWGHFTKKQISESPLVIMTYKYLKDEEKKTNHSVPYTVKALHLHARKSILSFPSLSSKIYRWKREPLIM